MKHEVLYHHGGEVVCACGAYFRTENLAVYPLTGLAKFATHVRETRATEQHPTEGATP